MRLVTVSQQNNKPYIAAVFYDRFVTQLTGALGEENYLRTMVDFIRAGSMTWNESYARAKIPTDTAVMLKKCKLHAPITPRSLRDFYAFEEHVKTSYANRGRDVPPEWYEAPVFYYGNTTTTFGTEEVVPYPSKSTALDYELEIACVIGKEGRDIPAEKAEEYIFGYMIFNDWSARDIQRQEMAVGLGPAKGKDFASSFGPYLVTSDELAEYHAGRPGVYDLKMVARVNDKEYSRGNMKDMHFSFGELIARASQDVTLYPGDVIASGTVGTGCLLELTKGEGPWLQPGDIVELEIEHLGILRNIVGDRPGMNTVPRQTAEQVGVLLVTPVTSETAMPSTPSVESPTPVSASDVPTPAAPVTPTVSPTTENLAQAVSPSAAPAAPSNPSAPTTPEDVSPEGLTVVGVINTEHNNTASANTAKPVDTKPFDRSVVEAALERVAQQENAVPASTQAQPEVENTTPMSPPSAETPADPASSSASSAPASVEPTPTPSEQLSQSASSSDPGVSSSATPTAPDPAELFEAEAKTPVPTPPANLDDNSKGSSHE